MRILKGVAVSVAAIIGLGLVLSFAARFTDGPLSYFPGGALSGVDATEPVRDWNEVVENGSPIELETRPGEPYSVHIEARIREGRLYSWSAWEHQWTSNVLADPRVVVRVDGTLYPLTATPLTPMRLGDAAQLALLHGEEEATGVSFRFDPRPR